MSKSKNESIDQIKEALEVLNTTKETNNVIDRMCEIFYNFFDSSDLEDLADYIEDEME